MGDTTSAENRTTTRPPRWLIAGVAVVLLASAAIRMVNANGPMVEFHPSRQYMSVVLAWRYDMALGGAGTDDDLRASMVRSETEPPLMELATVAVWRSLDDRPLWVPRALSTLVWAAGGVMLFMLLRRLRVGDIGVVAAVFTWSLQPFVVQATRVFQPDPLMVTAIVAAVWALVVHDERLTRRSLAIAAATSAVAIFVKAPAVFLLAPVYVVLAWRRGGLRELASVRTVVVGAVAITPALVFNVLGLYVFDFLAGKDQNFIFPELLVDPWFWNSWSFQVSSTFGWFIVLVAAVGLLVGRQPARRVGLALTAGYLLYGIVFTWNFATHSYYHLPLILPVALGIALLTDSVVTSVRTRYERRSTRTAVLVGTGSLILVGLLLSPVDPIPRGATAEEIEREVTTPEAIGEATDHSGKVIYLTRNYAYGLAYYGSLSGRPWPQHKDLMLAEVKGEASSSFDQRMETLREEIDAEFFVVTDVTLLDGEPGLEPYLRDNLPVFAEGEGWIVFDLR